MADAIEIDGKLFQERLAHLLNAWKNDKRSGDALFGGVASLVVLMGKVEDVPSFNKTNAIHVCFSPILSRGCFCRVASRVLVSRASHIASLTN